MGPDVPNSSALRACGPKGSQSHCAVAACFGVWPPSLSTVLMVSQSHCAVAACFGCSERVGIRAFVIGNSPQAPHSRSSGPAWLCAPIRAAGSKRVKNLVLHFHTATQSNQILRTAEAPPKGPQSGAHSHAGPLDRRTQRSIKRPKAIQSNLALDTFTTSRQREISLLM